MSTDWIGVPDDISIYEGFVYVITNLENGKKYYGQKRFWHIEKLPALKGRTKKEKEKKAKLKGNKRHIKKETKWKDYWGSSGELQKDIELLGKERFRREILFCCSSKSVMNYIELHVQIHNEVLFNDSYNNIVNIRLNGNVIYSKKEEIKQIVDMIKNG